MARTFPERGNRMKIEYDPMRDLLYICFSRPGIKAAETRTVTPGVHADFDGAGKLIGIEVIDASEMVGEEVGFSLPKILSAVNA